MTVKQSPRSHDGTARSTDAVRLKEIAETLPPVNDKFAHYTQSSAFSISLSRSMIAALRTAEYGIDRDIDYSRLPVSDAAMSALVRRGLIVDVGDTRRRFEGERPRKWGQVWQLTKAGTLMLDLLAEAGLVDHAALRKPLPPPPPGWLDPRPRLVIGETGRLETRPSQREEQTG